MTTLVILLVTVSGSYHIFSVGESFGLISWMILPLWVFCSLAETHRAPFDFSESESELVSGFNTEYAGPYFAFIFLTEYGVLLVRCNIISYLFLGFLFSGFSGLSLVLLLSIVSLFISFFFI